MTSAIQEGVREAEEYADDAVENGKKELAKQADIVALKADIAKLDAKLEKMESRLESRLSQTTLHITRFLPRFTSPEVKRTRTDKPLRRFV